MIGGPPSVGGHPAGPQPAPQRPGTAANQTTAPMTLETSASLRMTGTPIGWAPAMRKGLGRAGAAMGMRVHPASERDHIRASRAAEEQVHENPVPCTTYKRWLQITKGEPGCMSGVRPGCISSIGWQASIGCHAFADRLQDRQPVLITAKACGLCKFCMLSQ